MEFNLVSAVLCCLWASVFWITTTDAIVSPEEYWKLKLPNITMPKPIKDILPSDASKFGDIHGITGKDGLTDIGALYAYFSYDGSDTKGLPTLSKTDHRPRQIPNFYFLLETDLHEGTTMTLDLPTRSNPATFIPRQVADSIPFSPEKIPDILNRFSVNPNSPEAQKIKRTMSFCNTPKIEAEKKLCVTSLESMIDFARSELGSDVRVVSTELYGQNRVQNYSISGEVRKLTVDDKEMEVSCHKKNYVYAVFFCHMLRKTRAYSVPLVGEDGTKVSAVAVCHGDTATMNPHFWAFRVLGIKPGTAAMSFYSSRSYPLVQLNVLFYLYGTI